ncbi:FAD/NAD(P)-binding domain-containing protein [Auriculariales sp. MPI-PUGE-AT-0066]|nr:FAD/NAD(P)-binding domain-containing protein [Auriculariales sp. MPI-PUGE-AT-0066]
MCFSPLAAQPLDTNSPGISSTQVHGPEIRAALFPPGTPLFPKAQAVLNYLHAFAEVHNLRKYITCGVRIVAVHPVCILEEVPQEKASSGCRWRVTLSTGVTRVFDHLIIATGRYRHPFVPRALLETDTLQRRLRDGSALHAAWFRNPAQSGLIGKRVLLLGGGPSGMDICSECAADGVCERIWWAAARLSVDPGSLPEHVSVRSRVVAWEDVSRPLLKVMWNDGTTEKLDVDVIILATGYQLRYPFLSEDTISVREDPSGIFPFASDGSSLTVQSYTEKLSHTSQAVLPLVQHVLPLDLFPSPTLAVIGLTWRVAPFPIFEAQARFAIRIFDLWREGGGAPLDLDAERSRLSTRYSILAERGGSVHAERAWHSLEDGSPEDQQFAYRRHLIRIALDREDTQLEQEIHWAEEMYDAKVVLRKAWHAVEALGDGEVRQWLDGVGEGDRETAMKSWMGMIHRLLGRSSS